MSTPASEILAAVITLCISAITAAWILGRYSGKVGARLDAIDNRLSRIETVFTLTVKKG